MHSTHILQLGHPNYLEWRILNPRFRHLAERARGSRYRCLEPSTMLSLVGLEMRRVSLS